MTCIIVYTTGKESFICGDKMASDDNTKFNVTAPKIFEKKFITETENTKTEGVEEVLTIGCTTSFRMTQLLEYNLKLPVNDCTNFAEYLITKVIPEIRKLFKDEWGSKSDYQDVGGGDFIILINHRIFHVYDDFAVLESTDNVAACGSGAYHATGAMKAMDLCGIDLFDNVDKIYQIVHDCVCTVSSEYDILKY